MDQLVEIFDKSDIMPGVIAVSDFVRETREDINSPTTAVFVNKIPQCKETVVKLEEVSQRETKKSYSYTHLLPT